MNTFGFRLRLTTFGESHGVAIGGVLDGFPAGFAINEEALRLALERRRPGQGRLVTARREADEVRFLSGLYQGRTLGTPLAFVIENKDQRSHDYSALSSLYRPGHADYTYQMKYGHRDPRGGGRASARETAVRVVAGALCAQWLAARGVEILGYLSRVGTVALEEGDWSEVVPRSLTALRGRYDHIVPCPLAEVAGAMATEVETARSAGDSVGGVISCRVLGLPVGLGEPLYDKLSARLGSAMLSINAVKGFELGDGFAMASQRGSAVRDEYTAVAGRVKLCSNHAGGVLGGISTGAPLCFRVAFKPTSSISLPQQTVTEEGLEAELRITGRHDPCVALRAVPIVEAMTALVLMDFYLVREGEARTNE